MPMSQQQHLRLQVMMSISHPEEYYQQALKSKGIDWSKLSHEDIALWKATLKAIEADILIQAAEEMPVKRTDGESLAVLFND
jgi:hypothetical protein